MDDYSFGMKTLPIELRLKIFSYLRPFDLLRSRLVSRAWNFFLTSTARFPDHVTFLLTPSNDSISVLNESQVPWADVTLTVEKTETGLVDFTPEPIQNVTSLRLNFTERTDVWPSVTHVVGQFGSLSRLTITESPNYDDFKVGPRPQLGEAPPYPEFQALIRNLEGLTLEINAYERLRNYLTHFSHSNRLISLEVVSALEKKRDERPPVRPLPELIHLITACAESLKFLKLVFSPYQESEAWEPIVYHLKALDLTTFHSRDRIPGRQADVEGAMESYIRFLKSQPRLKDVGLSEDISGRELLAAVPADIERLDMAEKHAVPQLLGLFSRLTELTVRIPPRLPSEEDFDGPRILQAFDWSEEYGGLRTLALHSPSQPVILSSLGLFPRLTSFTVTQEYPRTSKAIFTDTVLQEVIRVLLDLRTLRIESSIELTDFGITGVPPVEIIRLKRQGKAWAETDSNRVLRTGIPLHSLKRLEKLRLYVGTQITDAGIEFGLRLKGLRELSLEEIPDVTDAGLKRLGELNPCLIKIYFGSRSSLTDDGKAAFRQAFQHVPQRSIILS